MYPLAEAATSERGTFDLPINVQVSVGRGPEEFSAFCAAHHREFDVVIVSRPNNMRAFAALCAEHPAWFLHVPTIYDAEAIFAVRDAQHWQLEGHPLSATDAAAAVAAEVQLAAGAAVVLAVSERERTLFVQHGFTNARVLGHALDVAPTATPFQQRNGFAFIGAIHTETSPNADAIVWFVEQVWPQILRTLGPSSRLTIAGFNHATRVRKLAGPTVAVVGVVEDLAQLYESVRVFVAPLRFAAGIPLKLYQAAAYGVPVVTTPLLREQLGWYGHELAVGDTAAAFAQRCVDVHQDNKLWTELRTAALARVAVDGSRERFRSELRAALADATATV